MAAHVQVTYPPLDVPKPVADGVWIVDSGPVSALGLMLPVRMTVLRLDDGGLLLHSPTRWSPPLAAALQALGPVGHLVLPNIAHWRYAREWQKNLPDVVTWGAPGLRARPQPRASGLQVDRTMEGDVPAAWGRTVTTVAVPGGFGFREVALFHAPTRTLVLTDLVQGLEPHKLPPVGRLLLRALGGAGPAARPPVHLRAVVRLGGAAARNAAQRLVALDPARVIFAHGRWFTEDGAARLKRSLAWLEA